MRSQEHEWWNERFWDDDRRGPRVVKLHGDILAKPAARRLVFSRADYRERLYGNPAYRTFLRAVLATSTVLYLGFSFTDAYLNELRSEILALLEHGHTDEPIAYAIVNDMSAQDVEYFGRWEGVQILTYDSQGLKNFEAFDGYLEALYEATNPVFRLGGCLAGRRLLWLDAMPSNNEAGMQFLLEAAGSRGCVIDTVLSWGEAVERLGRSRYDLLITHWGHADADLASGGRGAVAERILMEMRSRDLRAPVIVFASGGFADENRRTALALGAQAYVFEWRDLFREIERVLG